MKKVRHWFLFHFTLYALIHIYLSSVHLTLGGETLIQCIFLINIDSFVGSRVNEVTGQFSCI